MKVTGSGTGMVLALETTEQIAGELMLEKKDRLHLRLLAEELLGLIRSMIDETEADYWLEKADGGIRMHHYNGALRLVGQGGHDSDHHPKNGRCLLRYNDTLYACIRQTAQVQGIRPVGLGKAGDDRRYRRGTGVRRVFRQHKFLYLFDLYPGLRG